MKNVDPPIIEMPSFRWPSSGWWFTVFGTLVGGFLLLMPSAVTLTFFHRLAIGITIACIPTLSILLIHGIRFSAACIRRVRQYRLLHETVASLRDDLGKAHSALNALVRERQDARSLHLDYCYYYQSVAVIVLKRKRGFKVDVGAQLLVVDRENGRPMGTIEITDTSDGRYMAKGLSDIDPLWLGYIRQAGMGHSAPPPDAIALSLNEYGDNDA